MYNDGTLFLDEFGNTVQCVVQVAAGSPTIAFSVYGHNLVGGYDATSIRDYDYWWEDDLFNCLEHQWDFYGSFSWNMGGWYE